MACACSGASHAVSDEPLPTGSIALQTQYSLHIPLPADGACATGTRILWAEDDTEQAANVGFGVDVPLTVPVGPAANCERRQSTARPMPRMPRV